jgi:hypothetical protein
MIEVNNHKALDEEGKERVKKAIAEELNEEGVDADRVNLLEIEIIRSGTINAKLAHK